MLGLRNLDLLLSNPVAGGSREGFVIENLICLAPINATPTTIEQPKEPKSISAN